MKTTVAVLAAATIAAASPSFDGAAITGDSTHYGGNLSGGMCSFTTYTLPSGIFGTAFSGSAWQGSGVCGGCMEVTGPNGNTIKAMVVDQCPECAEGHLDLFQDAFSELGELGTGIISTSYTWVPCGITSPLKLHNKSGTSPYWFSMQVVNANEPVETLEVSVDGGSTWQPTERQPYNFFENASGFGTETVDVRVTSSMGNVVTVRDVSIAADSETAAGSNFESSASAAEPSEPEPSEPALVDEAAGETSTTSPPVVQPTEDSGNAAPEEGAAPTPVTTEPDVPVCRRSKHRRTKRVHARQF